MRILVTGGSGYLGSHLLKALHQKRIEFCNLDLVPSKSMALSNQNTVICDLRNFYMVAEELKKFQPDVVVHLAALKSVPDSFSKRDEYFKVNHDSTINLARIANTLGVKKFIFSSSAAVYGKHASLATAEDSETFPLSPYGESKLEAENSLFEFASQTSMQVIALRVFNLLGFGSGISPHFPEASYGSIQHALWLSVKQGEPFKIFGNNLKTPDGTAVRDYIHPDLVVDVLFAILKKSNQESFSLNVGSGVGVSVLEILHFVEKKLGIEIQQKIQDSRPGDIDIITANIDHLRRLYSKDLGTYSLETLCSFLVV